MSRVDEIRERNEARKIHDTENDPSYIDGDRGYQAGKRDDDYDRGHVLFFQSACSDIDALLTLLDKRTEALREIEGIDEDCLSDQQHAASRRSQRIAREALAEAEALSAPRVPTQQRSNHRPNDPLGFWAAYHERDCRECGT